MKSIFRIVAGICMVCLIFCSISYVALAAEPGDGEGTAQPRYITYPDPDLGEGYMRENIISMSASEVTDFLRSNGSYIGGTRLSETLRFGFKIKLAHSLADITHNYAMRGGVCYYDYNSSTYKPAGGLSGFINSYTNNAELETYMDKSDFMRDTVYYAYIKNLIGSGSVSGTVTFFRTYSSS